MPETESAFSFEKTKKLRGMLIVGIFIFHFCHFYPTQIRPDIGHVLVGAFFMLSGFGLMESLNNKKNYLDNFIGNKIARLLVPVWIAGLFVLVVYWTVYNNHSILNEQVYLFDLISGGLTITGTWFVIELIFFYIIFYIAFKYLNKKLAIVAVTVSILFLMILFSYQQQGMWAASGMMFPVGLMLSHYKNRIESLKPHSILLFSIVISLIFAYVMKLPRITPMSSLVYGNLQCLFITLFVIISLLVRKFGVDKWVLTLLLCNIVYYTFQTSLQLGPNIVTVLPVISVFLILAGLNVISPITNFVGNISYEFYIIHAIIIQVSKIWFADMLLCFISSFILSLVIAIVIKKASRILLSNKKCETNTTG